MNKAFRCSSDVGGAPEHQNGGLLDSLLEYLAIPEDSPAEP
jgi:hypothetical protein